MVYTSVGRGTGEKSSRSRSLELQALSGLDTVSHKVSRQSWEPDTLGVDFGSAFSSPKPSL